MAKPFHPVQKSGNGYVVIAKSTGKPLSHHPLPKATAAAQLRAVEASKHAKAVGKMIRGGT